MTRTTARLSVRTAAATAPLLLLTWAAGPAQAHGAPTDPVSRVYACSPEGAAARTPACRAAIAANGGPFTNWDNLRVAGVAGRDRQVIPDGRLCSGNLPAYRGLDLARRDWPATRLTPGGHLTLTYASTIAHTGTFKLYLTKRGYDPSRPLTWSDLPARPFAEVTDPPLRNGAYRVNATLPTDRSGRHVLYTIWQNSSTPDTYYACSDVVFPEHGKAAGAARSARPAPTASSPSSPGSSATPAPPKPSSPVTGSPVASPTDRSGDVGGRAGAAVRDGTPVAETAHGGSGPSAPLLAGGAAAVLLLTGGAALTVRLRRPRRR
ncbi:lytic polysaccharide monooxygenase [Streptomyces sp. NPDC017673]|uniref:lytic polysaccharide monooxygenase auxiliary activity family 9 protein n=1 Tax=unclassified Streptomyces TaxID=2593676 RepID=UPI0037883873